MDFVVKLLKSKNLATGIEYNIIWIIQDKLTKWAYLILFKESFKAI